MTCWRGGEGPHTGLRGENPQEKAGGWSGRSGAGGAPGWAVGGYIQGVGRREGGGPGRENSGCFSPARGASDADCGRWVGQMLSVEETFILRPVQITSGEPGLRGEGGEGREDTGACNGHSRTPRG